MSVKNMNTIDKYGIVEKKKEELDELTNQILDAQFQADQFQAIVLSLTEKSNNFKGFLATAEENRSKALNNKNLLHEVLQMTLDLKSKSNNAYNEMAEANINTKKISKEIKKLIDELIFAAEVINKLANTIVRKKATNPLISEELIELLKTAGDDANSAVALTLVALKSVYASQATNLESEAAATLSFLQARKLYAVLSGTNEEGEKSKTYHASLKYLLNHAYKKAKKEYEKMLTASKDTTKQLNLATTQYRRAQIKLNSLKSGFGAARAAAYAS